MEDQKSMTRIIFAIVLIFFAVGCGRKEPPKIDAVGSAKFSAHGDAEKRYR